LGGVQATVDTEATRSGQSSPSPAWRRGRRAGGGL